MNKLILVCFLLSISIVNSFAEDTVRTTVCYREKAGFIVGVPDGWVNDKKAADSRGVCLMMVPEGTDFHSAPAVMYPNIVNSKGGTLEETAKIMATTVRDEFIKAGKTPPKIHPGKEIHGKNTLAIWYFDDGPHPNRWEAAAYIVYNDQLFMLVLSAYTKNDRTAAMPAFIETAKKVFTIEINNKTMDAIKKYNELF